MSARCEVRGLLPRRDLDCYPMASQISVAEKRDPEEAQSRISFGIVAFVGLLDKAQNDGCHALPASRQLPRIGKLLNAYDRVSVTAALQPLSSNPPRRLTYCRSVARLSDLRKKVRFVRQMYARLVSMVQAVATANSTPSGPARTDEEAEGMNGPRNGAQFSAGFIFQMR